MDIWFCELQVFWVQNTVMQLNIVRTPLEYCVEFMVPKHEGRASLTLGLFTKTYDAHDVGTNRGIVLRRMLSG